MESAAPSDVLARADERLDHDSAEQVTLPSGQILDLGRSRWDGVLTAEEIEYCQAHDVAIGYDPAQLGVVLADRLTPHSRPGVVFRPWTDTDVAVHLALLGDHAVWEQLPDSFPEPFTDDTSRDLIALANADIGHEVLAVEVDGEIVGQCLVRFAAPNDPRSTAEIAYWLGRAHWGRGVMSRVLPAFVDRCFDRHSVDELEAWILPANEASVRVAERSGFARAPLPDEAAVAALRGRAGFSRWAIRRSH